eukprot:1066222-Rhodomonas_salina.1
MESGYKENSIPAALRKSRVATPACCLLFSSSKSRRGCEASRREGKRREDARGELAQARESERKRGSEGERERTETWMVTGICLRMMGRSACAIGANAFPSHCASVHTVAAVPTHSVPRGGNASAAERRGATCCLLDEHAPQVAERVSERLATGHEERKEALEIRGSAQHQRLPAIDCSV